MDLGSVCNARSITVGFNGNVLYVTCKFLEVPGPQPAPRLLRPISLALFHSFLTLVRGRTVGYSSVNENITIHLISKFYSA